MHVRIIFWWCVCCLHIVEVNWTCPYNVRPKPKFWPTGPNKYRSLARPNISVLWQVFDNTLNTLQSHTRTLVRECCKGDDASQWRSPKFDPPARSNPVRGNHKNWQRWLRRGPLHLFKSSSRFAHGFPFRVCVILRAKLHNQKVLVY